MPAARPRAAFEPIRPDIDLKVLVEKTPNFHYVDRISCKMIEVQGQAAFEKLVLLHVIIGGKPLVIDGYEEVLDPWTFSRKWLLDNCSDKVENARVLNTQTDMALTMGHYLKNMGKLTNQFFDRPGAFREKERQRVYLKDIDCPNVWVDKLREYLPTSIFYLNESTGEAVGSASNPDQPIPVMRGVRGLARAGDLMSSLPPDMRAENLMCYIGHEGTYTPSHREMCASLGHNIMVDASTGISDDGQVEKPGSSIWFMTESKERHVVSEYWLSVLGHDIEVENHFAQVVAWKKAPFSVYVVEQRPGDLILIPPLAPHQVWNRGTCTMKVAWNRTTVETLEMAINEALPRSRIVCRDEQYKNKAIIYYTLQKYSSLLTSAKQQASQMAAHDARTLLYTGKVKQLFKDFRRLFIVYKHVLLAEVFGPDDKENPKGIEYIPFDSNVTCAYCRGNIFNRFLTCPSCKDVLGHNIDSGEGDPYDVCMDCYAMGRSCACISNLKWVEQFRWKELAGKYETWRNLIIALEGGQISDKTPLSIAEERRRYGKKTLAEVCKDQLKRRPWKDIRKQSEDQLDRDEPNEDDDEEIVVGDDGTVKSIRKKPNKTWLKNSRPCHVCNNRHPNWKMAACTTCERAWCYGSLFRGWDKMPIEIMEDSDWSCPHCLGICFAGHCRKDPKMNPYEPKGTLLGHETKRVADARSVEALVDFSVSNLTWLRDDASINRTESSRVKRARAEADVAIHQEPTLEEEDDDDEQRIRIEGHSPSPSLGTSFIDPALCGSSTEDGTILRKLSEAQFSTEFETQGGISTTENITPTGYTAVNSAGYAPLSPSTGYAASAPYTYPAHPRPYGMEPIQSDNVPLDELRPFNKRGRLDEDGDISMTKRSRPKKSKLTTAGFQSSDLADGVISSKAKNEVQRQFEKEKERKAIEKAKVEGRFILLQAKLRGKKRIVKLKLPAARLASIQTRELQTRNTVRSRNSIVQLSGGNGEVMREAPADEVLLLQSDVNPRPSQNPKQDATIVTTKSKKSATRFPQRVERDGNYNAHARLHDRQDRSHISNTNGKRKSRNSTIRYQELDGFSEEEEEAIDATWTRSGMAGQNSNAVHMHDLGGDSVVRGSLGNGHDELAIHDESPNEGQDHHHKDRDETERTNTRSAAERPSIRPYPITSNMALDADEETLESVLNTAERGELGESPYSPPSRLLSYHQPPTKQALPEESAQRHRAAIDDENKRAKLQALEAMDLIGD